jgi:hypothetical protein
MQYQGSACHFHMALITTSGMYGSSHFAAFRDWTHLGLCGSKSHHRFNRHLGGGLQRRRCQRKEWPSSDERARLAVAMTMTITRLLVLDCEERDRATSCPVLVLDDFSIVIELALGLALRSGA